MANLTLTDLSNEVYAQTGISSSDTDSNGVAMSTNVTRWLNFCQQDICSRWPWAFMLGREAIATIADYTTGTVSVSAGSTTVTGAGGASFTTTQGDGTYFIQFSSANDWYRVSASTPTTTLTLEKAYQQTSNLSAGTFKLRKFFYSLSSTADEVVDVRNWDTPVKLIQADLRTIDVINPLVQSTSPGYAYLMFGTDASGNLQFMPYPFPNDTRLWEFRTKKRPTDMVNSTDSPSIPNKYAHVIAFGGIAVGFAYKNKFEAAEAWNEKFEARVADMKREYRQSEDYQPVMNSIDRLGRSKWINFPEGFPSLR